MAEPLETAELLAFARIVDTKSLTRAAAELRVPRATISRRLARLEERLATRLLRRTTRSLVLTESGQALYRHARIVLDALQHAEASVRRTDDVIRGALRVSGPPLQIPSFYALFSDFARQYPDVRLQVHLTTHFVDLARGDYDVAIRATATLQPGLVARTLARTQMVAVAAPAYLSAQGVPRSLRDLRHHRCLMGFAGGDVPETQWPSSTGRIHVEGAFFSNDLQLVCAAAIAGQGIALLPSVIVHPALQSGALLRVLPGLLEAKSQFAVVYLEREFVPPQVKAFVEAVATWARAEPTLLGAVDPLPAFARAVASARQAGASTSKVKVRAASGRAQPKRKAR